MTRTGSVALTVIVMVGLAAAAAFGFVYSGVYNVAADKSHRQAVDWLLETTRTQSIKDRVNEVPTPTDLGSSERISSGAIAYAGMCQNCHLAPGIEPTPLHRGLNPRPPVLAEAEVNSHRPDYLFWVIKHGIIMTGMPAWGETHNDDELWDLVAFVQKLPELSRQEYASLIEDSSAGRGSNSHAASKRNKGHGHDHRH